MNILYNLFSFLSHEIIDTIAMVLFILFFIFIFNYFIKDILKKNIKIYLYTQRLQPLYRLLFFRYEYLLNPVKVSINIFFVQMLINLFISYKILTELFIIAYAFLFLWFLYECIKFLLYGFIIQKIHNEKNARRELVNLFLNISKMIILIIAILIILSRIGIDITALVASLGIGSAILALSAKDTLTNFFDSLRLISSDAFRQGDWIQTNEFDGFVTEVGLITTKIRTFSNAFITVPNSKLANNYIKNWSKRRVGRKIKFHIKLKIQNNSNEVNKVIQNILIMLNNHDDIVNDEKIQKLIQMNYTYKDSLFNMEDKLGVRKTMLVYLDKIDIYSMDILVYAFSVSVEWRDWLKTKEDVLKSVIDIVDTSSLEFAYPKEEIIIMNNKSNKNLCE